MYSPQHSTSGLGVSPLALSSRSIPDLATAALATVDVAPDCSAPGLASLSPPLEPATAGPIAVPPLPGDRWSTLRFRRAKDSRGWALLGIPSPLYPVVIRRLFEEKAKFIAKHSEGGFVSLLFEAPSTLAATLALRFPAPPGCDPLVINESGSRILAGQAAKSTRAQYQVRDRDQVTVP